MNQLSELDLTEEAGNVIGEIFNTKLLGAGIVLLVSALVFVILKLISKTGDKRFGNVSEENFRRRKTMMRMLFQIAVVVLVVIDAVIILQIYGVNVTSLVTGLGIASVIVALALQETFKDIMGGFSIISGNYFSVGDFVKLGDIEGRVIDIKLRFTTVEDNNTGNVVALANRNVEQAEKLPDYIVVTVPVSYKEKKDAAESMMKELEAGALAENNIRYAEYLGLEFMDAYINYKLLVKCDLSEKSSVKRKVQGMAKDLADERGIRLTGSSELSVISRAQP